MLIQRHVGVERWFYNTARAYLDRRPREGIHASDLLAPRKSYWAKTLPRPPTDREVVYFLAGRAHEEIFTVLAGLGAHRKVRGEWRGPDGTWPPGEGIRYELDVLVPTEDGTPIPVEIKTNRRPRVLEPAEAAREYELAIRQLGMYAAFLGCLTGYLVELHLVAKSPIAPGERWAIQTNPEVVVYQITWSEDELHAMRVETAEACERLRSALRAGVPEGVQECPAWMCGREHHHIGVPQCPQCGTSYPVGKLTNGKKQGVLKICPACRNSGTRVELQRPTKAMFVPTCRWWDVCQPVRNWPAYAARTHGEESGRGAR